MRISNHGGIGRSGRVTMTAATTGLLVLIRHGQSDWNLDNRFTGWADVPLTQRGELEAERAGRLLCNSGLEIDVVYASALNRSIASAEIVRDILHACQPERRPIEIKRRLRLNERHYGALTGRNKRESQGAFGPELREWRSTLDGRPPPMEASHPFHDPIAGRADLQAMLDREGMELPLTESARSHATPPCRASPPTSTERARPLHRNRRAALG